METITYPKKPEDYTKNVDTVNKEVDRSKYQQTLTHAIPHHFLGFGFDLDFGLGFALNYCH
jgi:hypothetical protein